MTILTHIEFGKDFRGFKSGTRFDFDPHLNVIVGDNGSGKSSLVGCIRSIYADTRWTFSELSLEEGTITNEPLNESCNYIDLSGDLLGKQMSMFDSEYMTLQVQCMNKSSGQGAFLQLAHQLAAENHDVTIVDEPERGLSEAKQKIVAHIIKEHVDKHPNRQFFVITHSYDIMSALTEDRPLKLMPSFDDISVEEYKFMNKFFADITLAKLKAKNV